MLREGECKHKKKGGPNSPIVAVDFWIGSNVVLAVDFWIGSDTVISVDFWINSDSA